jgi:hypothetical protein
MTLSMERMKRRIGKGRFAERACGKGSFRALEAETQPRR